MISLEGCGDLALKVDFDWISCFSLFLVNF